MQTKSTKLKYNFYQTQIAAMHESGTHDWWKHMKTIMRLKTDGNSCMQGLANKTTDGDCSLLANTMNDFFVSVSTGVDRWGTASPPPTFQGGGTA